jgi:hypothetical protein
LFATLVSTLVESLLGNGSASIKLSIILVLALEELFTARERSTTRIVIQWTRNVIRWSNICQLIWWFWGLTIKPTSLHVQLHQTHHVLLPEKLNKNNFTDWDLRTHPNTKPDYKFNFFLEYSTLHSFLLWGPMICI